MEKQKQKQKLKSNVDHKKLILTNAASFDSITGSIQPAENLTFGQNSGRLCLSCATRHEAQNLL